jgi:hypothetical protein
MFAAVQPVPAPHRASTSPWTAHCATSEQLLQVIANNQVPPDIRRAVEVEERATLVNDPDPIRAIIRHAQLRGWVSPQMQEAQRAAAAEQTRRAEAQRRAAQEKAEQIAQDERASFARRRGFWDEGPLRISAGRPRLGAVTAI